MINTCSKSYIFRCDCPGIHGARALVKSVQGAIGNASIMTGNLAIEQLKVSSTDDISFESMGYEILATGITGALTGVMGMPIHSLLKEHPIATLLLDTVEEIIEEVGEEKLNRILTDDKRSMTMTEMLNTTLSSIFGGQMQQTIMRVNALATMALNPAAQDSETKDTNDNDRHSPLPESIRTAAARSGKEITNLSAALWLSGCNTESMETIINNSFDAITASLFILSSLMIVKGLHDRIVGKSTDSYIADLYSHDYLIRSDAREYLIPLAKENTAILNALAALADQNYDIQKLLIECLSDDNEMNTSIAIDALIPLAKENTVILEALVPLADQSGTVQDLLIECLSDDNDDANIKIAIEALISLKENATANTITALLNPSDPTTNHNKVIDVLIGLLKSPCTNIFIEKRVIDILTPLASENDIIFDSFIQEFRFNSSPTIRKKYAQILLPIAFNDLSNPTNLHKILNAIYPISDDIHYANNLIIEYLNNCNNIARIDAINALIDFLYTSPIETILEKQLLDTLMPFASENNTIIELFINKLNATNYTVRKKSMELLIDLDFNSLPKIWLTKILNAITTGISDTTEMTGKLDQLDELFDIITGLLPTKQKNILFKTLNYSHFDIQTRSIEILTSLAIDDTHNGLDYEIMDALIAIAANTSNNELQKKVVSELFNIYNISEEHDIHDIHDINDYLTTEFPINNNLSKLLIQLLSDERSHIRMFSFDILSRFYRNNFTATHALHAARDSQYRNVRDAARALSNR